ncbi:hypothetical protein E0Z10_g10473 [Xylaria hypoxylon]|uniref:Uncharacterized protein n=1 Tax=Xylaria hypoxylon TaxID=37992 RepID=A0A4Z0YH94_9PEZI|nr:hypothetical protein E0Z10_g10473 [Xylaria hypoxylon]
MSLLLLLLEATRILLRFQKVKASDSDAILDGSQFQSLDIPPLCNTITVYVDWKKAENQRGETAPGTSESPSIAEEPAKFALSRSRRSVKDSDLVATISLKKQRDNSWLQRHSPVPRNYFNKIVIGPIDNENTAAKKESTSAENKAESPGDNINSLEDGATLSGSQGTVEKKIMPVGDKGKAVEDESTTSHATPVKRD